MAIRGIFISREVMQDDSLNQSQKFILSEIEQLSELEKGCIASNKHFSNLIGITKENVSKNISALIKKKYISAKIIPGSRNHMRKITLIKMITPPYQNDKTPLSNRQETKERKTIDISTTTRELKISDELRSNIKLINTLKKENEKVDVLAKIDEFENYCLSIKKIHKDNIDLYKHFMSWMQQNKTNRNRDVKKELDYFLLRFNQISNKTYRPTKQLEDLLRVQLENGFNSEQMAIATKKMRSSDDRNWHKKTLFLHATPEHLLKDNNLNKYLNQNF